MNFFYKKSRTPVRASEVEFKPITYEKEHSELYPMLVLFLEEFERLIMAHHEYILFHEMYNVLHLLDDRNKSENIVVYFFNIMRSLKVILSDLYDGSSVYADVFLTLFKTGLLILSRDTLILHAFFDGMSLVETNVFLNKLLPENAKVFGHDLPRKSVADILLRSAREENLPSQVDYLISKGASSKNGTVLQEIIRQLPDHSRLRRCLSKEKLILSDTMCVFLQEISHALDVYKGRLFSKKSASSDKAAAVLKNNLLDNHPSFARVMINMTRFMAEKTLMKKPGELFKRLFELWQAGLWILSQHRSERELFLRISDSSNASILRCRLWTESLWEAKALLKTTVGDYLMRISVETQQAELQAMLAQRQVRTVNHTLFGHLSASLCLESALAKYFSSERLERSFFPIVSSGFCDVTMLSETRGSLDTEKESLSGDSRSWSGSPWFWQDPPEYKVESESVSEKIIGMTT